MKLKTARLFSLIAAVVVATCAIAHAQTAAPKEEAAPAVQEESLWQQIKKGGLIMIPIALCSIGTVFLIGDGIIRTSRKRVIPQHQELAVKSSFRQGDYVAAFRYCKGNPSPFTNVCRVAIVLSSEGKTAVEESVVGELAKENSRMMTYISYLSVIGVCAPMIGLTGTVVGMIEAFKVLGHSGIGDPSKLSEAIGQVLVATASGLFVAIPAFFAYYLLRNRAVKAIHDVQDLMNVLFRKMPYDQLAGANFGEEEIYAAQPNWITPGDAQTA